VVFTVVLGLRFITASNEILMLVIVEPEVFFRMIPKKPLEDVLPNAPNALPVGVAPSTSCLYPPVLLLPVSLENQRFPVASVI